MKLEDEGWVLKQDVTLSHSQLLDTDLTGLGGKIIPTDFAGISHIGGPKILQLKRVKDVR